MIDKDDSIFSVVYSFLKVKRKECIFKNVGKKMLMWVRKTILKY